MHINIYDFPASRDEKLICLELLGEANQPKIRTINDIKNSSTSQSFQLQLRR